MSRATSLIIRSLLRRSDPLVRLGWLTLLALASPNFKVGAALVTARQVMQRRGGPPPVLLYRYDASPGETMRIKVIQGDRVLSDRVIEA
ncbi:MAG: hypothetical protein EHM57_02470 [Actinobacteria bacterium]|nr:MAG: hypothetical protein EHM57_02470 [Actinomycetota bacterium]